MSTVNLKITNLLFFLFFGLVQVGCSSLSTKNTILRDMAIGAVVGGLIAQSKTEYRDAYTVMYAGVGAAGAGAASAFLNLKNEEQTKSENEDLKAKLEHFQKMNEPQLLQKGNSLFSIPIPKEVSGLVEPGEWKRYKLDQWVQDQNQPNTWYRQVEMFEIIPPVPR